MKSLNISTITPVYAGREYLPDLITRIEQVRNKWENSDAPLKLIESIFVNDGSTDDSLEFLYSQQKEKPWINIINLSRNYGQHQATIAGILHSSGDWIVTLDEDLQHDPLCMDNLLAAAVQRGDDIVYANPLHSVHGSTFRDWSSRIFKLLVSRITGNPFVRDFNSFRLVRGSIARAAGSVCTHGTYFDIALCWFTDRISSIRLPLKDVRFVEQGKSGYTVRKLFSHARRMIVTSEAKVIRLGAAIGFFTMLLALILGAKISLTWLFFPESIPIQGWTSLFLAVLFFGGLLAVLSGIMLEYVSVILLHIQGKPTFFVVDRLSDRILVEYYRNTKAHDCSSETEPIK